MASVAVVMLSTDKAVYPINAMGMSKAMMEKLMIAKSRLQSKGEDHPVRHPLRQRDGGRAARSFRCSSTSSPTASR